MRRRRRHFSVAQVFIDNLTGTAYHFYMSTNHRIETRRQALMAARTIAITQCDWQAMNEITKRLAKLPVKGEVDYPRS
jgi:hypothetical protein